MKKYFTLYIALLNLFSFNSYSQQSQLKSADKKYTNLAYIDAIKTYERVAEKGYQSADMYKKIGNSYYFNGELESAAKWYSQLFAMNTDVEPEYYFRYSQSLQSIGENQKANEMQQLFRQKIGITDKSMNYLDQIKANSGRYQIENAGINSQYSDYGTAKYGNKIVFATARDTGSLSHRIHSWNNQYFTNLYTSELAEDATLSKPEPFDDAVKSRFHEATPVFTKDGKTMYFSRNNFLKGKKGKSQDKTTLLKIYRAYAVDGLWTNVTELPFNSDQFSTAHPALSPDEKTLYFASNRPDSFGESDIYKVQINEDGSFGTPINLGNSINTIGRESFPSITEENEMYFASDGQPGLGGFDIFVTKINPDGTFTDVQNVGESVNSAKDDFAYFIDTKTRRGFFSSNRSGGQGSDDIYQFLETKRLRCEQELYGEITDENSKELLPNTTISLYNKQFDLLNTIVSDSKGNYSLKVDCDQDYYVRAEKTEYNTKEQKISISKLDGRTYLPIALEKTKCKVTIGDDLGKCFGIKNIYFDFDKYNIRVEAAIDLEKILIVLTDNPGMKLDIRSHTDSRGTFKYNEILSGNRAKATIQWLIKNGVNPNRLTAKGYGEAQLVNHCSDGVSCTEEEHQLNRRSEFIITAL
ncbi:OmpA family protein [Flavobacterium sp.]|uniref:OmpA family protein n=1 Tax=Flavobacterium sp. TaxID=239 RepID=UPI0025D7DB43|nr:OmpA family protein [Flavobacterium sp.]